jgi:rhodanese-related sulfurtransferase
MPAIETKSAVLPAMVLAIIITAASGATGNGFAVTVSRPAPQDKEHITARDLKQKLDKGHKVIILDARSQFGPEIIKGAVHVPTADVEEWAKKASKKAFIVTYCTCAHDEASDAEMKKLRELGFTSTFSLTGGLEAARSAGIPIVPVQ